MLIINEELLAIDQAIDSLVLHFLRLPEVENYRLKRQKLENTRELQELLLEFQELKESYDKAKEYESFRPDVRDLKVRFADNTSFTWRGGCSSYLKSDFH